MSNCEADGSSSNPLSFRAYAGKTAVSNPGFDIDFFDNVKNIEFFYVNDFHIIPKLFILIEIFYYSLGILMFFHAFYHKKLGLFLGWLLFAFNMEFVGVIVVKSHYHAQFTLHLSSFCPFKEALWYSITTYSSFVVAASIPNLHPIFVGCIVGFYQGLKALQLETIVYRKGIDAMKVNPDFLIADTTCTSCTLYNAPLLMIFANTALAIGTGFIAKLCDDRGYANSIVGFLCIGLCIPIAYSPFVFMNMLKFWGCFEFMDQFLYEVYESIKSFDINRLILAYSNCMKKSSTTEGMVLAFTWTLLILIIFSSVIKAKMTSTKKQHDELQDIYKNPFWSIAFFDTLYNLSLLFPLMLYDESGVTKSASLSLFVLLYIAQIGLSCVLLQGKRDTAN